MCSACATYSAKSDRGEEYSGDYRRDIKRTTAAAQTAPSVPTVLRDPYVVRLAICRTAFERRQAPVVQVRVESAR